jgi:hypothetical protein
VTSASELLPSPCIESRKRDATDTRPMTVLSLSPLERASAANESTTDLNPSESSW